MSDYRVQLDVFRGPLDLLLFLIRRDEIDIYDIPIARVTEQYLAHLRTLEALDPNVVGEFLVLASTLLEIKSRALLPTPPLESGLPGEDPRAPLVRQLLEYKRFKDAARSLGTAADDRARKFVRRPGPLPKELEGVELEEASVWDLLSAFTKVMSAIGRGPGEQRIFYDDTPIELYQDEILAALERSGALSFASLFEDARDRPRIIGRFLAVLELVRSQRIRAEQEKLFGEIYLFLTVEVEAEDAPESGGVDADEAPPTALVIATAAAPIETMQPDRDAIAPAEVWTTSVPTPASRNGDHGPAEVRPAALASEAEHGTGDTPESNDEHRPTASG